MFKELKDAYNKYVLMEEKFKQLNKNFSSLLQRIEALEKIIKTPGPSKFTCRSCGSGIYKATNTPRSFGGIVVGNQWKCDKCGHVADELLSQTLSK